MSIRFKSGIVALSANGDAQVSNDIVTTGSVFWVDSVNGNDANAGTELAPYATLGQAITSATANNGDIIVIKANSSFTSATSIVLSKAGVRVFGLGVGTSKPTFIVSGNVDLLSLTGESSEINNLRFAAGTAAHTSRVSVGAAGVRVINCDFLCSTNDLTSVTIPSAGTYCRIEGCTFTVTGNLPQKGISIASASVLGLRVKNCIFDGGTKNWVNGAIYSSVAHLNYVYDSNTLKNQASIVHTAAAIGFVTGTVASDGSYVRV